MKVYVLGGAQTDFARCWSREGAGLFEMMSAATRDALADAGVEPADVEVAHVGNFTAELFRGQGHLGGMFASIDPALAQVPASRHEAACASGSMALLAAMADLEAGRYGLACVVGVEEMRNVSGEDAARHLGAAAWAGREGEGAQYLWPHMFDRIAEEVDRRDGVDYAHLMAIARNNFANAARNPNAHARRWTFDDASFTADDARNPVIEGRIRRQDCGQVTDGAAAVVLASEAWVEARGVDVSGVPVIAGWGHRTAPLDLASKLAADGPLFPHVAGAVHDAWRRAGIAGADDLDGVELHDCFTITEYVLLSQLGLDPRRAIEDGDIALGGALPINPSGGLIGAGHPVGATGVRMVVDAARQVTGRAGDYQIDGARRVQTLNIGGSFTTVASFVVAR